MGTENKKKTTYGCKIHVMRHEEWRHSSSPRPPLHSSPHHRAFRVTESLTLAAFRLGQQPARSVLTSAEPGQKICSDCVFPGTRLTLQTALWHIYAHTGTAGVWNSSGSNSHWLYLKLVKRPDGWIFTASGEFLIRMWHTFCDWLHHYSAI